MNDRSIPIIRLYDTLIVSIQLELSDRLVLALKQDLAFEINRTDVRALVIEVSGVDIFDSYIARSIRDIAQIARLMGVETIVAGLDPAMATTLVEMGMTMQGVRTALNLENALHSLDGLRRRDHSDDLDLEELIASEDEDEDVDVDEEELIRW